MSCRSWWITTRALGLNRRNQEFLLELNPPPLIGLVDHKVHAKAVLARHGLPVPDTLGHYTHQRALPSLAVLPARSGNRLATPRPSATEWSAALSTGRLDIRVKIRPSFNFC